MKQLIIALIGLVSLTSNAQIEKDLGDFTQLKTTNRIKVELIPSTESKVVLDSKDEKSVNLINKNGRLSVKNNIKELVSDSDYKIVVKVYYKELKGIDAESGSFVHSSKALQTKSLKLSSSSGSVIQLNLKVEDLEAKAFAGANITLEGTSNSGTLISNAGGAIIAQKLKFDEAIATVNAGGKIDVNATNVVNATIRAGGYINVYGNPKSLIEKTTAGGSINRIK